MPDLARSASPVRHVRAGVPPFLLVHGTADVVEYLGNEELLHIIVAGADVVAVVSSDRNVRPGDVVTLHLPLEKIHLFDGTTEASLLRSRVPVAS